MPLASHTSFVRHLSIASADAMTPLPVYGMRSVSSAPCTVPSSPKRPCSAMNTRAKPSRLSSNRLRSAGSNACASTPRSRSAVEHRVAGQQRDLALGGRPAQQDGDLAERSGVARCHRFVAGSCVMRFAEHAHFRFERDAGLRRARRRARARSALRCRPRARARRGLTMKFACISDTRAPPIA